MNQAEQATHHVREKMTLKERAALIGTAVAVGAISIATMIPKGEAEPIQAPVETEVTAPEATTEAPSTTLSTPETTVITTEVEETPVTVAPEVAPTDETEIIRDGEGNVVPTLIAPLGAEAPAQPATTTEQGAQEPQEVQPQEAPASTVVDSGALVAVAGALPAPAALEQTTLFDNGEITEAITPDGGIAEATTDSGALVATATAAVPGN